MQPSVITIATSAGVELKYKSDRPLKADLIEHLHVLLDILIEDLNAYKADDTTE